MNPASSPSPHYATYFLDPHGFMLEVVCHSAEEA